MKTVILTLTFAVLLPFSSHAFSGIEVSSTDPFGLLPEGRFKVTMITSLPTKALAQSPVRWQREQKSLDLLQSLLKEGVPLVTGSIPEGTTADAFVLPASYELTLDVLKVRQEKVFKNILFIQAHATLDIIEHELQHLRDYEDGTFNTFMAELIKFGRSAKLSPAEINTIQDVLVEQRGHAHQQFSLLSQGLTKQDHEVLEVQSNYLPYLEALLPILTRLEKKNPNSLRVLVALIKKYEFPLNNSLHFNDLLPAWAGK